MLNFLSRKNKLQFTYFDNNQFLNYDVFISYRTFDSSLVRAVSEKLISIGLKLWFAEYNILLRKQDEFRTLISEGLSKSKWAILFTSKEWVESEHCRFEVEKILSNKTIPLNRIIEIRMSEDQEITSCYPKIKAVSTFNLSEHFNSRNDFLSITNLIVDFILEIILKKTIFKSPLNIPQETNHYVSNMFNYSLDLTNWKILQKGDKQMSNFDISGPIIIQKKDNFDIVGNLLIGLAKTDRGKKSPIVQRIDYDTLRRALRYTIDYEHPEQQGLSDREAFKNGYMWFLDRYDRRLRSKIIGLHLFYFYEYANFAVSYWRKDKWIRKYSLVLIDPKTKLSIEFLFTFGLKGSFEKFCEFTPLMETVVQSLKHKL